MKECGGGVYFRLDKPNVGFGSKMTNPTSLATKKCIIFYLLSSIFYLLSSSSIIIKVGYATLMPPPKTLPADVICDVIQM
jgi:hypothetical protein